MGLIDDNDVYKWSVLFTCPEDTLFEGGFFKAILTFPEDYPQNPPEMRFILDIYGTTRNYRPYRFFKIMAKHPLKFQNAHDNPTRIFLRNIRCYKDFIDYRLMDMRFIRCGINEKEKGGWDECNFWPLSYCFDYSDSYVKARWPCHIQENVLHVLV